MKFSSNTVSSEMCSPEFNLCEFLQSYCLANLKFSLIKTYDKLSL